jgi:4'-phosphopantetheinyl transferase
MRLVPLHDPLLPPGIEVHRLDLNLAVEEGAQEGAGGEEGEGAWNVLAPDERSRAGRFAMRADRARFVQTRAALRRLLARRLACRPADVPFSAGPHGKPCVAGETDGLPLFNVSHSGGHALIALADPACMAHVGIDIEACKSDLDVDAILSMAFTQRERREVQAEADAARRLRAFYPRWVGKEAVLKAVGIGMAEHLQSIGIHPAANGGLDIACAIPAWTGFEAMPLSAPPGYAAALAWKTKEPT